MRFFFKKNYKIIKEMRKKSGSKYLKVKIMMTCTSNGKKYQSYGNWALCLCHVMGKFRKKG